MKSKEKFPKDIKMPSFNNKIDQNLKTGYWWRLQVEKKRRKTHVQPDHRFQITAGCSDPTILKAMLIIQK